MFEKIYFLFYLIPLLGSLLLSINIRFSEKFIRLLSFSTIIIPCLVSIGLLIHLLLTSQFPTEIHLFNFELNHHRFSITTWIDANSIGFLFLTHLLGLIVVKYSHNYLNLEKGYQRFFATIQLFLFGMYVLSLAGSIDLFFAGWEIVGLSSFLLIAFYRGHNRSVINAWRIFNIYKVCDLGLLIGAVIGQAFFHEATKFSFITTLNSAELMQVPESTLLLIGLFMILAAAGKSAQFPFYNWPSRAMEGPTPSSAIFYGALSIHAGVFLLIRTAPIWQYSITCKIVIFLIGSITLVLSTLQSKLQANIKGQIAYSITAQIGIIFIELSLGHLDIALLHLLLHALFRCFQLLVSPSVVLQSLRTPNLNKKFHWISYLPLKLQKSLYLMASTEFEFDNSWRGFKFIGWKMIYNSFKGLAQNIKWYVLLVLLFILVFSEITSNPNILIIVSIYLTIVALVDSKFANYSILNLAISTSMNFFYAYLVAPNEIKTYLLYIIPWFIFTFTALLISLKYKTLNLAYFHAQANNSPFLANIFFISFIVLAGMPFSSLFLAEDMILELFISKSHFFTLSLSFNFMTTGIIYSKIYTRIFMGRPIKYFQTE
jgi:NADH-quinone oxidoreductase subunit L